MRLNYAEVGADAYKALMPVIQYQSQKSTLDARTRHLVELRVSQINGCAFCLDMHAKELRELGESQQRLDCLAAWRETSLFDAREKAILAWAESVTLVSETGVPDAVYERVREYLGERELVDLTLAVAMINLWNRVSVSFRGEPALAH